LRSDGGEEDFMPDFTQILSRCIHPICARWLSAAFVLMLLSAGAVFCPAASIRGVITDASGAKISGVGVILIHNGRAVASSVSTAEGSFEITTGIQGRFFLVVSAQNFRQLETPSFYAGTLDSVEHDMVLEPEWERAYMVVTATGTPTPQPQTSAATSVLAPLDLALRDGLESALRLMPGTIVAQAGQRGAQTWFSIRGGGPQANKILLDGVNAGGPGGKFDFGTLSTTAIERAEVYRGPDSNLYGADAASGVVSLTTPRGTTRYPSILFQGDAGNLSTSREELEAAGAHNKLDYLGAFSWLQTANNLPHDEYHVATTAANIGWQLSGNTLIRGTLHYGVSSTGMPNAWNFHQVADDATGKEQDLFLSASIDNQTTTSLHNMLLYGATRKREQSYLWEMSGSGSFDQHGNSLGKSVTIMGANGYSATGQAVLDMFDASNGKQVNNRDQLVYRADYRFTSHLTALIGFQYEDERGVNDYVSYINKAASYTTAQSAWRKNYDYLAAVHGDFKNRFFYTLGGSLERYSLAGTQTSPRAGLSFYILRPRNGVFSGTRVLFNFGDAVREPALTDQFGSLYQVLTSYGEEARIQQLHIKPIAASTARTYEGGAEQAFLNEHIIFRVSYFHNEFGREVEPVSASLVPNLLPNLAADKQYALEAFLRQNGAYGLSLNSQAYRAQGIESTVEGGLGKSIHLRGGYTYLDAVVQRSFNSDQAELGVDPYVFSNGIKIGANSPLVGARPFRRAPHTGFLTASYSGGRLTGVFTSAFASRSDDTTFLENMDENDGNSLLLPNRNLDWGYAKLDLGGSFKLLNWLSVYAQAENLTDNRRIAPIGYPSLPFNFRTGLRITWTKAFSR
jgi:iron complex outermembrane receptor protein/vitamin B12 transporter